MNADPTKNEISESFLRQWKTEQKPYFALYAGDLMKREIIRSSRELVSSPHNYDGKYIKVFIGSPKVKLGININNVGQIHNTRSDWNEGGNLQRESRAIRDTSHITIIQNLQKEREDAGIYEEVRFEVKLYRHAAVAVEEQNSYSDDLNRYARAIQKEIPIQNVMRMLMMVAVDCNLNKNRNTLPISYDYSFECNYQKCEYVCYQKSEDQIDDSTYDIYYLKYKLREIIYKIFPHLRDNGRMRYQQIFNLFPNIPQHHIIAAINELIANKISMKDKYGNYAYVHETKDFVYLSNEYTNTETKTLDGIYYSYKMINILSTKNDDIFRGMISESYQKRRNEIKDYSYEDIVDSLTKLDLDTQVSFLEQALINQYQSKISGQQLEYIDECVLFYYNGYVYHVPEPLKMIMASEAIEKEKDPRGRKSTIERSQLNLVKDRISYMENDPGMNPEMVIFHILYISDYKHGQKRHGETERYLKAQGRYRIYKPSEGYWRDPNMHEYEAYSRIVSKGRVEKTIQIKSENPISGKIVDVGGGKQIFKIVDVRKEIREGQRVTDARKKSKGFVCDEHVPKQGLFFYAWWLGVDLNKYAPKKAIRFNKPIDSVMTEQYIRSMELTDDNGYQRTLNDIPEDELQYYYRLTILATPVVHGGGGMVKNDICNMIRDILIESDAIAYE